jgi:hypothetical protein
MAKFDEFLAPWEVDGNGKKLDEPETPDLDKLKRILFDLSERAEKAETEKDESIAALTVKETELAELLAKNETDEQRREREATQQARELEELRTVNKQRAKIEAIEAAFEKEGITTAQAKRLAKRVSGEKESDWLADAKELVEDGFKVGAGKPAKGGDGGDEGDNGGDDLSVVPQVKRSGSLVPPKANRSGARSVEDEIDQIMASRTTW